MENKYLACLIDLIAYIDKDTAKMFDGIWHWEGYRIAHKEVIKWLE